MKRIILFFFLILLSIELMAQYNQSEQVNQNSKGLSIKPPTVVVFGAMFGPSCDWYALKSANYSRESPAIGMRYGLSLDINLSPKARAANYYVSTGILFKHLQGTLRFPESYIIGSDTITTQTSRHYNAIYLTIPTGIKLKTNPMNNCIIAGNFGLYHGFILAGKMYDFFKWDDIYNISTQKIKNSDAAIFTESVYAGLGFEYLILGQYRATFYVNYSFLFSNYFSKNALSLDKKREKANIHSLEFILGFTL